MQRADEVSDDQLMGRIMQGESAALEMLYQRYASSVMGLAFKIVRDRALAEEVVQETFLRVWLRRAVYNPNRGHTLAWVLGIARNLAIDAWRRRQVRPHVLESEAEWERIQHIASQAPAVADAAHAMLLAQQLRAALDALPEAQRVVIELSYFQGLTRQEIAAVTGQPLGTIHTRARLALQKLRELLPALEENA